MPWKDVYYRNKALHDEWRAMYGNLPYEHFISEKGEMKWQQRKMELEMEAKKGTDITTAAIGYGATRFAGSVATAPVRAATEMAVHVMKKNYDRGFMEYRTRPYYVNYHIRPQRVRRRYTRPYRPYTRAYSLPFYYSRGGPAYHRNRGTRNWWRWR